ncbi:MAG: sulfite exporter TauE/SafE family protein [Chromatiaceae bacterium]|nr:sulfite exporter TauE/SafE family protein [Chromatiaceae bacterium]
MTLAMAFATGIFGALHCLGMCGGLAGGFFVQRQVQPRLAPQLIYHASRLFTYALLGMAGAWAGRSLAQTGLTGKAQGILMMGAGLLILVLGLRMLLARPRRPALAPTRGLEVRLEPMTRPPRPWSPLLFGTLNGLIPCSLVFSIALKAAATGDPGHAGLLMLAFGLGTLPMMAAVTGFGAFVGARARDFSARIAGGLVAVLGLWTLYEGYSFFDIMRGLANG